MRRIIIIFSILLLVISHSSAQNNRRQRSDIASQLPRQEDDDIQRNVEKKDSLVKHKDQEVPKGLYTWTVDKRFGDRQSAVPDTLSHLFMNTIFTSGMYGEYNTLGNAGSPRENRIFINRNYSDNSFLFTQPYDYFVSDVGQFQFTNTLSPFTNISFNTCGDRTDGEDHITAKFGVNAGRKTGVGFLFDYLYARGYYSQQSTSHFNYTLYGSHLDDRYQAHLLFTTIHQKVTENGGISDDNYITHPELFNDKFENLEIPTVLERNWNRNDNQHLFFTHRFNVGFNRKVRMTEEEIKAKRFAMESLRQQDERKALQEAENKAKKEGRSFDREAFMEQRSYEGRPSDAKIAGNEPASPDASSGNRIVVDNKATADSLLLAENAMQSDTVWTKNEYVPVTSFIHTVKFDHYRRIYQAFVVPNNFYNDTFYDDLRYEGDSIYDKTSHYSLKNTLAISLLEGFNKWAKAGVKVFATSDLRHYTLPETPNAVAKYSEHSLSIGGQLSKNMGKTFHYNILGEAWVAGADAGRFQLDASADVKWRFLGDTVTLSALAFLHRDTPNFYYRHYHSRHLWWDNDDMEKILHSRIEGILDIKKTHTTLRFAVDELKNHTYLAQSYTIGADNMRLNNTVSVRQHGDAITLFTASIAQNLRLGLLHWDNVLTFQKSTNENVLPVPTLNIYSNLYLHFMIARVLKCDLGTDVRFFTKYYAPDYSPYMGMYCVQDYDDKIKTGSYPIVNVYANFHLKHTRFFLMMSHVNAGLGSRNYFLTPHYPINSRILRFGLSWNFFN